ncbi:MAG: hypothetical protein IT376_02470 [Polyangiaceae bacterium]|nr:hypothetical protein [Polyangiaceae bacterium]
MPAPAAAPGRPASERTADAHADRVVLLPTAYTHPEGTLTFSSYELIFLQAGWAVSDVTQLSLTATPPIDGGIAFLDLSLKTVVHREDRVRVAAIVSTSGVVGLEEGHMFLGRLGGAVQLCADVPCRSSVTMAGTTAFVGPVTVLLGGVGLTWNVARWATLLLEVETLTPIGREAGQAHGIAVMPGFRFPYRSWALDVSLGRILDPRDTIPVLPFVAFTYRVLP